MEHEDPTLAFLEEMNEVMVDDAGLTRQFQRWLNDQIQHDDPVYAYDIIGMMWMCLARLRMHYTYEELMSIAHIGTVAMRVAIENGGFKNPETMDPIHMLVAEDAEQLGFDSGITIPDTLEGIEDATDQE